MGCRLRRYEIPPLKGGLFGQAVRAAIFHYDEDGGCTGEDTYSDGPFTADWVSRLAPADEATLARGR